MLLIFEREIVSFSSISRDRGMIRWNRQKTHMAASSPWRPGPFIEDLVPDIMPRSPSENITQFVSLYISIVARVLTTGFGISQTGSH
jgi:hypothetical protein